MGNVTQAIGADPSQRLYLAKNFQPDVDLLLTEGLNAFGMPGSGKSNFLSLLCEQLGHYLIPQLVFDCEGEYRRLINGLPHGVLATAHRCPSGYDILHKGLQTVMDLSTWGSTEAAALSMVQMMEELFTVAGEMMQAGEAVPCVVHLDEAAFWVPQSAVDYLSKDTRRALYTVFQRLTNRGRKCGLVPAIYTQYISQVHKDVIRRGGVQVFMRQVLDIDLKRYAEYIPDFDDERQEAVRSFGLGRAAVLLPDGSCPVVTFNRCKAMHASATPRVCAALAKFANTTVDLSALQMRNLAPTEQPSAVGADKQAQACTRPVARPMGKIEQRVRDLLAENGELTPAQLSRRANCSYQDAKKWRERIMAESPMAGQLVTTSAEPPVPVGEETPMIERVAAVLAVEPEVSLPDLASRADCPIAQAALCLQQLDAQVKKQAEQPTSVALLDRAVPDAYLRALGVLTRQPECNAADLARQAQISEVTARICLEVYAERLHK